jgi:serine/threonine-protein kinase HipA
MRRAAVYMGNNLAGILEERGDGFTFTYTQEYRTQQYPDAIPISKTMPVREAPYFQGKLFPFFDNLIPDGTLLATTMKVWRLKKSDRMGLLLACCEDCCGAVSIMRLK